MVADRLAPGPSARTGRPWIWPSLAQLALVLLAFAITLVIEREFNLGAWQAAFSNWDSRWYLGIASGGYPPDPGAQWAYLPYYPALIALLGALRLNLVLAGLLVSLVGSLALSWCLCRLGEIEFGRSGAGWTPWLLLLSPFGFFFAAVYTEALFFALVAAAMLAARRRSLMWAGVFAALAATTRLTGAALLPALLLEVLQQQGWKWRELPRETGWLLLVPAAVAGLGIFGWLRAGTPLAMLDAERQFGIAPAWPWAGFHATLLAATSADAAQRAAFMPELVAGTLGLPLVAVAVWRLRPLYSCFMLLVWLSGVCLTFWRSVPRYELAFFPLLFLLVPATNRAPWLRWLLVVVGGVSMAYGASRFARGLWLD